MDTPAVARRYFDAWNAHDGAAIAAVFAEGGTYADPTTGELTGPDIAGHADGLFSMFPDVCFEIVGQHLVDDDTVVVRWRMHGTNTGRLPDGPPLGRTIDLPGVDFIAVDGDRVRSVVGYFDLKTMLEQMGLQMILVPAESAGPQKFGEVVRPRSAAR